MAKRQPLEASEKRRLSKENVRKLIRIASYLKEYQGTFAFGFFSLILSTVPLLAFPKLSGEMLNVAVGKSKYFTDINQVTLILIGMFLIQAGFSFIRVYTFAIVSENGLARLRKDVFRKLVFQPLSFFDATRTGELMSRVTADIATLQDTFSFTLAELVRQLLVLIAGAALLLIYTPSLTLFMLLTFPVLIVFAMIFGNYIRKISRLTQDKLAETNIVLEESLQNIQTVKAFTNELLNLKNYTVRIDETVSTALKTAKIRGIFISFIIFTIFSGIVAVGWYGARQVSSGSMEAGDLFSFIIYTSIFGFSIAGLGDIYSQIQRSIGASERILEILDQPEEQMVQPSNEGKHRRFSGAIAFDNVRFSYPTRPDHPVLKGLNFEISPGEKVALVGRSGAGKSTIASLLMRFYKPDSGNIRIDGQNLEALPLWDIRSNIGIVPQEVLLFGGTIRENIAYGRENASEEEIRQAAQQANALDFIESFPEKFDTKVGDRGVKLSGGQRQRIAIARTILKNPAILVLDEATSSLDNESEAIVQEALENMMQGRTSLIIAHRLTTIRKADRILVIENGQVGESGKPEELSALDSGIYAKLLKIQWE